MTKENLIAELREIVNEHSFKKIDGIIIDVQTANVVLKVYDNLSEIHKTDYVSKGIVRMADIAWKIVARQEQRMKG